MIPAGTEWRTEIDARLNRAPIVLLFVRPHFIESRYCYEVEGEAALRRHASGEARVIPIILRPCAWEDSPFSGLQALPQDGRPSENELGGFQREFRETTGRMGPGRGTAPRSLRQFVRSSRAYCCSVGASLSDTVARGSAVRRRPSVFRTRRNSVISSPGRRDGGGASSIAAARPRGRSRGVRPGWQAHQHVPRSALSLSSLS